MNIQRLLLLPSAFYFLFKLQVALANCEAGAYAIHTTATYKKSQAEHIFLVYEITADRRIEARLNSLDSEDLMPRRSQKGRFEVKWPGGSCLLEKAWQLDPKYKHGDPYSSNRPYRLSLGKCELPSDIAQNGYLVYNSKGKTVRLPKALPIKQKTEKIDLSISQQIDEDWKKRDLYLFSIDFRSAGEAAQDASRAKGLIKKEMIAGEGETQTTLLGEGLMLIQKNLRIKNLAQALPEKKDLESSGMWTYLNLLKESPNPEIDYPLLYLAEKHKDQWKVRFIGDGSHCASHITRASQEKPAIENKPFSVSHAFDINGDGKVDILEINGKFAYWLKSEKELLVIEHQQGC